MPKQLSLVSLILILTVAVSCKKGSDNSQGVFQGNLSGTWVASEYVFDIGDGATWKKVTADNQSVISFDNSGKGTIFENGVKAGYYYQVSSDSTMSTIGGTSGSSRLYYSVAGDTLTIAGPCIEACGTRYLRAKAD